MSNDIEQSRSARHDHPGGRTRPIAGRIAERMRHHIIGALALGWLAAAGTGCSNLYIPPPAQMPLFSNAGEAHASVLNSGQAFGAQLAYSPITNLGLMASGMFTLPGEDTSDNTIRFGEIMAIYYRPLKRNVRVELGLGAGAGSSGYRKGGPAGTYHDGAFTRVAALADVGFTRDLDADNYADDPAGHLLLEFGFGLRVAYLSFGRLEEITVAELSPGVLAETRSPVEDRAGLFYEPAMMLRFGPQAIQMEVQLSMARGFSEPLLGTQSPRLTIGLRTGFGKTIRL